jgi:hypothetical protein
MKASLFYPTAENFEVFALQGCYTEYVDSCLLTLQDKISIPSSRVRQPKKSGLLDA